MRSRSILLTILVCLVAMAVSFAQKPQMGTWKLNESKSTLPSGMAKNTTVIYAEDGDNVKVTTDGTGGDGSPMHTEWTGKFDGKDYPLSGDPTADSRSYTKVDDHTLTLENKKGGQVVTSGRVEISPDGKSRTLTVKGKDSTGKDMTATAMYDKQ